MKFRIKHDNANFYPQYKGWIFWKNFYYLEKDTVDMCDNGNRVRAFSTYLQAKEFLTNLTEGLT